MNYCLMKLEITMNSTSLSKHRVSILCTTFSCCNYYIDIGSGDFPVTYVLFKGC